MTTHHGGAGHADKDRDLNPHIEDARNIDDNESTKSSETILAFRGCGWPSWWPPAQQPGRLKHSHQGNKQLMTMHRSQRRSASRRIGLHRPPITGTRDTLSHSMGKSTSTPMPTEPFGEVVC